MSLRQLILRNLSDSRLDQIKRLRFGLLTTFSRIVGKNKRRINGRNNDIQHQGCILRNVTIDIHGDENVVIIHPGSQLTNLRIVMRGSRHRLEIGAGCVMTGPGGFAFEDYACTIIVGAGTSIENHLHVAAVEPCSSILIGKNCMFSAYVDIRTSDSHSILDQATGRRINPAANVVVGDHVWLGAETKILKGSTIGANCVVGTRAIVTSDIPPYSLAVGVPARVVKSGVTWSPERIYS